MRETDRFDDRATRAPSDDYADPWHNYPVARYCHECGVSLTEQEASMCSRCYRILEAPE